MGSMDQIKLWEEGYNHGLPIIFNFFNNLYGMGGQTVGEAWHIMCLQVGAGVNPDRMLREWTDTILLRLLTLCAAKWKL